MENEVDRVNENATPVVPVTPVVSPVTVSEVTPIADAAVNANESSPKPPREKKYAFAVVIIVMIFMTIIVMPYISDYLRIRDEQKAEEALTAKETCRFKDRMTDTTVVLYYGRDRLKQYTKRVITTYDDEQHLNMLNNTCKSMSDTVKKDKSVLMECSNEQGTQTTTYQVNYKTIDEKKYQGNSTFTLDYSKDKSVQEILVELKRKGYTCS